MSGYLYRDIEILNRPADGVARIRYTDGLLGTTDVAVWTRVTLRKRARCALTGLPLAKGAQAYRPVGNQQYRSQRIAAEAIDG